MKEQINKLARGEFEYEIPQAILSEEHLTLLLPVGEKYSGSFKITSDSRPIKGICYSNNDRVTVDTTGFDRVENVIHFTVNTLGYGVNEVISGNFDIVTNAKEYQLPFTFKMVAGNVSTNMGNINNLFHFANLVQTETSNAAKVFLAEDFETVFLKKNPELASIYRVLKKSNDVYLAMEEFLIAAGKKNPVNIHIGNTSRKYEEVRESIKDTIVIIKDTWGYFNVDVKCDNDFIYISKNTIKSDDFIGNRYELEYVIDYEKMHGGINYATISFSNARQSIVVEIQASSKINNVTAKIENDSRRIDLFNTYISFRSKRIDFKEWSSRTVELAESLYQDNSQDYFAGLVVAQCKILLQDVEGARTLLETIHNSILESRNYEVLYAYYLYVKSLFAQDDEENQIYMDIQDLYSKHSGDWRILWVLMHIDMNYEQNKSIKLAQIKSVFYKKKMNSPVMYFEAVSVLNEQPYLLRVFDDFEIQVLSFACKRGIIGKNLLKQICDLGADYKNSSMAMVKLFEKIYRLTSEEKILEILCSNLIKLGITDKKYTSVYEESITHGLRIARLYENYIEVKDENDFSPLPRTVLMYFSYNNALDATRRAYLYANIIANKENDVETYNSYRKIMEDFCYEQFGAGNISSNLAIIYREFWSEEFYSEKYALILSKFMFVHKIMCDRSDIVGAYICHKELKQATFVQLNNSCAYGAMYTEDCSLVFEDSYGRKYVGSVEYSKELLLDAVIDEKQVYELVGYRNHLFDTYLVQKFLKYRYDVKNIEVLATELYQKEALDELFKKELAQLIAVYYYEKYTGNDFDTIFEELEAAGILKDLEIKEAGYVAETCIVHGMLAKAKELIVKFGCANIYPARLTKMCTGLIDNNSVEEDSDLVYLCFKCFINHKYDDSILDYLAKYYNGATKDMLALWEACVNFDVECYNLEERLLAQMLFVHSTSTKMDDVFASYNSKGSKERMVQAYLGYHCYNYFVQKVIIPQPIIEFVEARLDYFEDELLVEKLAVLKYYSDADRLSEKQLELCKKLLSEMNNKKIYFGFFKKFMGRISMPIAMLDKTYIEYRTNPKYRVTINYMIEGGESGNRFIAQEMTPVFEGIFVKELTLFYGESVQYYIVEQDGENETITESKTFVGTELNESGSQGRFDSINELLSCEELKDFTTLKKLLNSYYVKGYASEQLFKTMD